MCSGFDLVFAFGLVLGVDTLCEDSGKRVEVANSQGKSGLFIGCVGTTLELFSRLRKYLEKNN